MISLTKTEYRHYGLELVDGKVRDNLACGVVEPAISKIKSLRFATEAAVTILRIGERECGARKRFWRSTGDAACLVSLLRFAWVFFFSPRSSLIYY